MYIYFGYKELSGGNAPLFKLMWRAHEQVKGKFENNIGKLFILLLSELLHKFFSNKKLHIIIYLNA